MSDITQHIAQLTNQVKQLQEAQANASLLLSVKLENLQKSVQYIISENTDRFLSTTQVAEILGYSREWVVKQIDKGPDGYFPNAMQLNGNRSEYRIPQSDVTGYKQSKTKHKRKAA